MGKAVTMVAGGAMALGGVAILHFLREDRSCMAPLQIFKALPAMGMVVLGGAIVLGAAASALKARL